MHETYVIALACIRENDLNLLSQHDGCINMLDRETACTQGSTLTDNVEYLGDRYYYTIRTKMN